MDPTVSWGIIATILAIGQIPCSLFTAKHFHKKDKKEIADIKADTTVIKKQLTKLLSPYVEPILNRSTPEQKIQINNTVENFTTGIAEHLMSIQTISDMGDYKGPGSERSL